MLFPPRFDPRLLLIPALALMVAFGLPRHAPTAGAATTPTETASTDKGSPDPRATDAEAADAPDPGGWRAPLAEPVTVAAGFAPPPHPYGAGHRGVDLAGQPGDTVHSADDGLVSFAGRINDRGVVTVTHGGLRTTYEPLTVLVQAGQRVHAGDPLGTLSAGHRGCSPACLHWGLLRGEDYLDPRGLLRRVPPRLLPVAGMTIMPADVPARTPSGAAPG